MRYSGRNVVVHASRDGPVNAGSHPAPVALATPFVAHSPHAGMVQEDHFDRARPHHLVSPRRGARPLRPRWMRPGVAPDPETSCIASVTNVLLMGKEFR